jgi:hypothetical protein
MGEPMVPKGLRDSALAGFIIVILEFAQVKGHVCWP